MVGQTSERCKNVRPKIELDLPNCVLFQVVVRAAPTSAHVVPAGRVSVVRSLTAPESPTVTPGDPATAQRTPHTVTAPITTWAMHAKSFA